MVHETDGPVGEGIHKGTKGLGIRSGEMKNFDVFVRV